ncbi:hypothetical protein PSYJYH_000073 [Bacillus phage PSYJ-YH]|nr:hypothetical protein PSYJYH_000073 [Bacillus phage PSYJ-YH]
MSWNTAIAEEMEAITRSRLEAEQKREEACKIIKPLQEKKPFNEKKISKNKFEKWGDIEGYDGFYKVSTAGRIWSAYTNRIIKPSPHVHSGYLKVRLRHPEGHYLTPYVHRIVAQTFLENPHNKPEVNHNDGNRANCSVWNLSWMTKEENMRHAMIYGLGNIKLKPIEVQSIYYLCWATDMTQEEIAEMYGVSRGMISSIKNRSSWDFVTDSKVQSEMGIFE